MKQGFEVCALVPPDCNEIQHCIACSVATSNIFTGGEPNIHDIQCHLTSGGVAESVCSLYIIGTLAQFKNIM